MHRISDEHQSKDVFFLNKEHGHGKKFFYFDLRKNSYSQKIDYGPKKFIFWLYELFFKSKSKIFEIFDMVFGDEESRGVVIFHRRCNPEVLIYL